MVSKARLKTDPFPAMGMVVCKPIVKELHSLHPLVCFREWAKPRSSFLGGPALLVAGTLQADAVSKILLQQY